MLAQDFDREAKESRRGEEYDNNGGQEGDILRTLP
jgi:hypothetical protein